ncbi:uncharacterized protein LOC133814648 [Humulus lupulus]|uniref:uncharacterized protein LOC133814648 n=1 Tax=Humulus lupulus TaxID=3486 RepID=UPI002B414DB9|nr:uncharacterized protein LOC133814648 [Humulus lupulus]
MAVLDVCRINKIGIGALQETKIKGDNLKDAIDTCFQGWNYHNSIRVEGQILLIWKESWVKVEVIKDHSQFLHCKVKLCITGQEFCFTVVYGSNQLDTMKLLWSELSSMPLPIKPWLILGDFNAAFNPNDRRGGRCILKKEIEDARSWLDLDLVEELSLLGTCYTWSNNQEGDNRIYSKLDRVFVNEDWLDIFPSIIAAACWEVSSDHCVVILKQAALRIKGCELDQVSWKLLRLKHELKKFNWRIIGDVDRNYEDYKAEFQKARSVLFSDPQNQLLATAERIAFQRFKQQEKIYGSYLRQKSNIEWIQFGNENSAYFHAYINKRKRANRIASFVTEDGRVEDSYPKVISHFINHFKSVLGCPNKATGKVDYAITALGPVLSIEDQLALIKPFSYKDVKVAMFSISSIKSPGLDGFGAALNSTILTLIPKMDHPNTAADFRPIVCCTTLYKCISKMLCHRVSGILPKLVNQNQGAFIKDRSLAHNVLILQDLLRGYKRKYNSPRCLLKIGLSKAYDSIDWDFLENLLKALNFLDRFIRWIMICMRGASYCLMLNGHLHANTSSIHIIQQSLEGFSAASGLIINKSKSRAYFGGVSYQEKSGLLNILQLNEGEFPLTYLGLPLRPTKWKAMDCDLILKKIRQRLCVWASRNLSYAGQVQLIQSVLLGIRNYWMSSFLLPQSVLKEIDQLCKIFLWGGKGNRSKFHLTSRELVCCPKSHGGLGFKEGPIWNRLLLSKFIWAISSKQDLLWVKWVNCIYLKGSQIWDYKLHSDASWYPDL